MSTYDDMKSDLDSGECGTIDHRGNANFCGRHLGQFNEEDDALTAIRQAMEEAGYWPNVYTINDHGNVTLIDSEGKEVESWV